MPINDTYVVPAPVVNFLCEHERSFLALRLVHGLLYVLDTALRGKMALVPAHFSKQHSVRTSTLAAAVGPEKATDNRWVHAACLELADQNILKNPTVQGRVFRFELGKKFSATFSMPTTAFAVMRTDQIRQCRTLHDLIFLSLTCLHGGKDRPRFLLPRIPMRLKPESSPSSLLPQEPPVQVQPLLGERSNPDETDTRPWLPDRTAPGHDRRLRVRGCGQNPDHEDDVGARQALQISARHAERCPDTHRREQDNAQR